jgi:hypothetical protein
MIAAIFPIISIGYKTYKMRTISFKTGLVKYFSANKMTKRAVFKAL